jgi:hypothetical protein
MINCKYDLLNSEYRDGNYIVYKPDALSNTTALQVRSTKFDLKPDVITKTKVMHTKLSLAKYNDDTGGFGIQAAYDTMNIPQYINSSTFKLENDVVYDSTVSPEDNVKRVIKMYSDEVKQWLFNFSTTNNDNIYQLNADYIRNGEGGCIYDVANPASGSQYGFRARYTASNAYIVRLSTDTDGMFREFIPEYKYNSYGITSLDSVSIAVYTGDANDSEAITLSGAMVSQFMQFPDPSRGSSVNFKTPFPITFVAKNGEARMHYADYTSTSYLDDTIKVNGVSLNEYTWNPALLWSPTAMFWNRGGMHIGYHTSTSPIRFSIAFCKYIDESSALTNTATVAYGASEVTVNTIAVLPDLEMDAEHLAMLVPMYHYMIYDDNYFVVALFHNVNNVSAADPTSFKGLYILCMETGDMYNASTGFNHVKFNLDSSFDVTDLLYMYGWQQYDDAAELGSNAFQYTTTTDGSYTVYTFTNKRIEICPYKYCDKHYLVCNPELYDKWYTYDLDSHEIHMITNVPVSRNHCITLDGMDGFRFEVNNKTDYIINNEFLYPLTMYYDENIINSIGIVRPTPLVLYYDAPASYPPFCAMPWNEYDSWSMTYKPNQTFEPIEIDKTTSAFRIHNVSPYDLRMMYFVVDITTDDRFLEFHHGRIRPEHTMYMNLISVDIPYILTYNTTSTSAPFNNIKVYINEFLNNDMFVCNGNELSDVKLKQTAITSTNQSFRIRLYDEDNNIITQEQLKEKYGVASIDLDFLF